MAEGQGDSVVNVVIDGQPVEARPGELVIDAAERHGVYIPRFCYHNRMRPVGMCRMCIVDIDTGRGATLTPSCMVPVAEGMTVDTTSERTKKAQDGVLEFLLINHPLDCPVCDKGGECPLQDQTMAYGPGESRFVEEKRHHEKPIPINDLVLLDRERCILCDRCTRFAKEVAGDPLIHFIDRGSQTQVNTFPDDPFASYFSGNTVQICPVGALTATPYRFKARPWDLEIVESTATTDSLGSRVVIQSSRNQVLRLLGVDSDPVNWGWLSDRERFNFEALASPERLSSPQIRHGGELAKTSWSEAVDRAARALRDSIENSGPGAVGVIGGARLTNEDQYAWVKLAKGVLGTDNVDAQLGDGLPAELVLGLPRATIDQVCAPGGTILLIGPDPKELLGTLYLRMRHAVLEDGAALIEIVPGPTGLTALAAHSLVVKPGDTAEVVQALLGTDVDVDVAGVDRYALGAAAATLDSAGAVTVVFGRTSVTEHPGVLADAAAALLGAIDGIRFLPVLTRGNVNGALDMGMAPGLLPGRVGLDAGRSAFVDHWPTVPAERGSDTAGMLRAAAEGRLETLVLLGADPLADFPDRRLAQNALGRATVIAIDLFPTASVRSADVVFPAAGFAECSGTFTNVEGRVSPLNQKVTPPGTARTDWLVAVEIARALGADLDLGSIEEIQAEVEELSPLHRGLRDTLAAGGTDGVLLDSGGIGFAVPERTEVPSLDGYSLRLTVGAKMYGRSTMTQQSPSLAGLGPGTVLLLNPSDFARLGVEPHARVRVSAGTGHSVVVPVEPDEHVARSGAWLVGNQLDVDVASLLDVSNPITDVRVDTL